MVNPQPDQPRGLPLRFGVLGVVTALLGGIAYLFLDGSSSSRSSALVPGDRAPESSEAEGADTELRDSGDRFVQEAREEPPVARVEPLVIAEGGVRFVYDDGRPAAHLRLYGVQDAHRAEVAVGTPAWGVRTDELGVLALEDAERLGSVVAARLGDAAVFVLPFGPGAGRTYVLPSSVDQKFVLDEAARAAGVVVDLVVECVDRRAFPGVVGELAGDGAFADRHVVRAHELERPLLLARVSVQCGLEGAGVSLPRGVYEIAAERCTFGWSLDPIEAALDGATVVLRPHRAPVVRMQATDAQGRPRKAQDVLLVIRRSHPNGTRDSSEVRIPFQQRGEEVEAVITVDWRDPAARYAVKVQWWGGAESETESLPLEALSGALFYKD